MAGYKGHSMSNNAVAAYAEDLMPMSKWTKKTIILIATNYGFSSEHLDQMNKMSLKDLRSNCLEDSGEWHHTSKMFNKTEFYGLKDEEMIFNVDSVNEKNEIKEIIDFFRDDKSVLSLKAVDFGNNLICYYVVSGEKDSWTDMPKEFPITYITKEQAETFIGMHNEELKGNN